MHKRSSRKKDLNESAYALVQKVTAPSSSGLSGPITTAAQAKRLLQLFPDTMFSAQPPPPREACEDKLALEVIEENGGVVNPQRPFHLQDKTLAWLERHERIVSRQVSTETVPAKNPAAVALGKLGGLKGGKARATKLSAKRRRSIARKAALSRWSKPRQL